MVPSQKTLLLQATTGRKSLNTIGNGPFSSFPRALPGPHARWARLIAKRPEKLRKNLGVASASVPNGLPINKSQVDRPLS